jgi:hypothetical protein
MLDMRLGNDYDIPFIMNLVRDGIASGTFFCFGGKGFEIVKSDLESVIQKYRDNIPIGDYLFVFDDQLKREPVGFALLTGRNDFAGRASHLEIRMLGFRAHFLQKSHLSHKKHYLSCCYCFIRTPYHLHRLVDRPPPEDWPDL